jgi:hypothetical protein
MGKHERSYERVEKDLYPSPAWVIEALADHVQLRGRRIWECAAGSGKMAEAMRLAGAASVYSTDIAGHGYAGLDALLDFLCGHRPQIDFDAIITNPPFGSRGKMAEAFITTGLLHIDVGGFLALLLPADFDSAKTRARYFGDCPQFAGKIVLTRRPKWFDHPGSASPKENSAWFLWQRDALRRPPILLYAPTPAAFALRVSE